MKAKSFLTLLSLCLLFLLPLSLCAQEPVCGKCLKKKSNCPYRCNHPTCKTCGKVCGARVNPCPYNGKHPKCNACGKLKENCAYKGNHPTCSTCGKVCGASSNACPYGGNHPKCNTCGEFRENCSYGGNHPTCSSCGKVCGASSNACPYGGNHPKCSTCGKLQENCPYKGNHPTTGTHAGHEWVDLGLSVKWATCNVGASSPTGYGNYYAWGETSTKSRYDDDNCKTWKRSLSDIRGNSSYDAARANWGGSWRLPTKSEYDELVNNCTRQWTTQNGVKGMRFTSKKNGNSVFFPAAGWRRGSSTYGVGENGRYWSSTPCESNTQRACYLYFGSGGSAGTGWYYRGGGRPVRPVLE